MQAHKSTFPLQKPDVDSYHDNGFIVVDALTTKEEISQIKDIYDELFAKRSGREIGDQFDLAGTDDEDAEARLPQILGPSNYAPELAKTVLQANALALAKQLLGGDAQYGGDHAILKPAKTGAATPWHQDEAYWDPRYEYNSLSIWVPLQDSTIENGCMQFIPKSHTGPILEHRPIGGDVRIHGLEIPGFEPTEAIACPIQVGSATVHHNRTLHYAGPNQTGQPRRAYIMVFGLPAKEKAEPSEFHWQRTQDTPRAERARHAKVSKSR